MCKHQDKHPTSSTLFIPHIFAANVPYFWTSGRLCDFDGCDRPDLFPKNINGWFWSANQVMPPALTIIAIHCATDQVPMPPTNSSHRFHDWSSTGGLRVPQPDNREETQLHGDTESCMAVLNNYYGDGQYFFLNIILN